MTDASESAPLELLVVGAKAETLEQSTAAMTAEALALQGAGGTAGGENDPRLLAGAQQGAGVYRAGVAYEIAAGEEAAHGVAQQHIGQIGILSLHPIV